LRLAVTEGAGSAFIDWAVWLHTFQGRAPSSRHSLRALGGEINTFEASTHRTQLCCVEFNLTLRRTNMARVVPLAAVIAVAVSFAALPACAQRIGGASMPHLHAINPSLSLSTRPTSPAQQQIQQDYRSNLLSAQRELSQSNPSGLSREQITIGHQLNDYNSMPR